MNDYIQRLEQQNINLAKKLEEANEYIDYLRNDRMLSIVCSTSLGHYNLTHDIRDSKTFPDFYSDITYRENVYTIRQNHGSIADFIKECLNTNAIDSHTYAIKINSKSIGLYKNSRVIWEVTMLVHDPHQHKLYSKLKLHTLHKFGSTVDFSRRQIEFTEEELYEELKRREEGFWHTCKVRKKLFGRDKEV